MKADLSTHVVTANQGAICGRLIINADDWGRDRENTDRTFDCFARGAISSASAMVFMEDSERAAEIATSHGVDCGLHLNLTSAFTARNTPRKLADTQSRISRFLRSHRYAQIIYHPGLRNGFEYVVKAQLDEFLRIFGVAPERIDGHHHMHLCSNVIADKLLPAGTIVRRNFTFASGEKGIVNRVYRGIVDRAVQRRHRTTDGLYSLPPLSPAGRVKAIFSKAQQQIIEVETHPVNADEYRFLTGGDVFKLAGDIPVAPAYRLRNQ